jgi:DNA-binding transcriptional MerR regulator
MFKIGEFSKIAQVSGSQLRYYDEIGLLKPAKIDEWTGYRYYSAQQIPRLNRILALKDLGLSLEQIQRMLDSEVSSDEIRGMFALRKAQIEQSLQDEIMRLQQIEARLNQIDDGVVPDDYEIIVKSLPAMPYLSLRETLPSFDVARMILAEMTRAISNSAQRKNLGQLTVLMHEEMFGTKTIDLEMGFTLQQQNETAVSFAQGRALTVRQLPPVETMVTAVRVGIPQTSHQCRAVLANWVEANGYEFDGVGREIFIVPPRPGHEDETVMEIQYPITKVNTQTLYLS